jgi:hypothetical protein
VVHSEEARELLGRLGGRAAASGVFLSGHSAGGNIASLLAIGLATGAGAGATALAAAGVHVTTDQGEGQGHEQGQGHGQGQEGGGDRVHVRGLVCLGGVYSLFKPLDGLRWKNRIFYKNVQRLRSARQCLV